MCGRRKTSVISDLLEFRAQKGGGNLIAFFQTDFQTYGRKEEEERKESEMANEYFQTNNETWKWNGWRQ